MISLCAYVLSRFIFNAGYLVPPAQMICNSSINCKILKISLSIPSKRLMGSTDQADQLDRLTP